MGCEELIEYLICLECKSFGDFSISDKSIICNQCKEEYPLINGIIPIIVKNNEQLLSYTYRAYVHFVNQQKFIQSQFKKSSTRNTYRSIETIDTIVNSIELNISIIERLKGAIESYLKIDKVITIPITDDAHYFVNFDYIRRDWSGQQGAEDEISATVSRVNDFLMKNSFYENDNSLFLGSGMGRIAWELKTLFKKTFALDNSFTMIGLFHELLKNDLELYEINFKNCMKIGDICKNYKASLKSSNISESTNYFTFVGDASNLPFADSTISNIFSIYFTDVLPLRVLIQEVKRVLKPNGIFFHFGPLHYHFNEYKDMLTADEIKKLFEKEGFQIIEEDLIELTHHYSEVSLSKKIYTNWMFCAQKNVVSLIEINLDIVLSIDKGLEFIGSGRINSLEKNEEMNYQILLPSKEKFKGSELVLEITRRVDGKKTLFDILGDIELEFEFKIEDKRGLFDTIRQLIEGEVFKIEKCS